MFFLGVDGGGSHTRVLICDQSGRIISSGLSGPTNLRATAISVVRNNLFAAMGQALGSISPIKIDAAHLGIAGVSDPSSQNILLKMSYEFFKNKSIKVTVSNDIVIAHEAGHTGAPGLVLIAGTGSACYGKDSFGHTAECGGWGDLIDDSGSGSWIGLRALQSVVRVADGRLPKSMLVEKVIDYLGIDSMKRFKERIHNQGLCRKDRASIAPIVIDLAESGDTLAKKILNDAVHELCRLALVVRESLKQPKLPIFLCGGLTESQYFRKALSVALEEKNFVIKNKHTKFNIAVGALILALKSKNKIINESILQEISRV